MLTKKIQEIANTEKLCKQHMQDSTLKSKYSTKLNYKKIETVSFNINEARQELEHIIDKYGLFNYPVGKNKTRYYYKGLSLTSHKNETEKLQGSFFIYDKTNNTIGNEHYVGVQKTESILELKEEFENDFEFTEACSPFFKNIFSQFKTPITRIRILELGPGGVIPPHVDYPIEYGIKIHAYLKTNPNVICEVAGEKFHIPEDGFFYWMDISKPHSVVNLGTSSRISLCINLNPHSKNTNKNLTIENILDDL